MPTTSCRKSSCGYTRISPPSIMKARLPAWIFAIARNSIADHFRRKSRAAGILSSDFDLPLASAESHVDSTALSELSRCLEPPFSRVRQTPCSPANMLPAFGGVGIGDDGGVELRALCGSRKEGVGDPIPALGVRAPEVHIDLRWVVSVEAYVGIRGVESGLPACH
jgi:hypothetical protein